MVRIFAAGDLHGDILLAKKLAQQATDQKADLILLNGDLVEDENPHGVMYYFVKTGKQIFLVPGNHDWLSTDFLAQQYGATNLHGTSVVHQGIGIIGCGGTPQGIHMLAEKEMYDIVKQNDAKLGKTLKKILLAHVHPAGTTMEKFSPFVSASKGLRKAIETTKPDIVLCGHVHEAEGIEERIGNTLVINVGKKGRIIEL